MWCVAISVLKSIDVVCCIDLCIWSHLKLVYLLNPLTNVIKFPCRFLVWMTCLKVRIGYKIPPLLDSHWSDFYVSWYSVKSRATVSGAYLFTVVTAAAQVFPSLLYADLLYYLGRNLISSYQLPKSYTSLYSVSICLVGSLPSCGSQSVGIFQRNVSWQHQLDLDFNMSASLHLFIVGLKSSTFEVIYLWKLFTNYHNSLA